MVKEKFLWQGLTGAPFVAVDPVSSLVLFIFRLRTEDRVGIPQFDQLALHRDSSRLMPAP